MSMTFVNTMTKVRENVSRRDEIWLTIAGFSEGFSATIC